MKGKIYKALIELRRNFYKRRILSYYASSKDAEICEIIDSITKNNELNIFNYEVVKKYSAMNVEIEYDNKAEMYYVIENKRPLYFKRGMKPDEIKEYYRGISMEQDISSPHRYLSDYGIQLDEDDIVIDLGGAEGNFVFKNIDKISKAIIVECDEAWAEALKMTFRDSSKVVILNKMISDVTDSVSISIDELVKKYCGGMVDFVKMDIEGMEVKALNGAKELLRKGAKFAICSYHNQGDFELLASILKNYNYKISHSKGFMTVYISWNFCKPYLRRGLIFGEKELN